MKTRAITGFFFIAVMLGSVLAGPFVFVLVYLLLAVLCLQEFNKLIKQAGFKPNVFLGNLNAIIIYAAFALTCKLNIPTNILFAVFPVVYMFLPITLIAILVAELYRKSANPFSDIAFTFLGILLTTLPFCFFHIIAYVDSNRFNFHLPMAFLIMLWSNDTGAYLTGRWLGRTKLFERHSPKKTWEGFFGGVLISAVAGYILSIYFKELPWNVWVSMAVIIGCVGTLGDLVESMFKRSLNIKDSGGILPGHGGLLDRFDGLLLAAPVIYTYLYFVTN